METEVEVDRIYCLSLELQLQSQEGGVWCVELRDVSFIWPISPSHRFVPSWLAGAAPAKHSNYLLPDYGAFTI